MNQTTTNKRRRKFQIVWHGYHDCLLMPTDDLEDRITYIKQNKLHNQLSLRLRLIKPVKGRLPEDVLQAGMEFVDVYYKLGQSNKRVHDAHIALQLARGWPKGLPLDTSNKDPLYAEKFKEQVEKIKKLKVRINRLNTYNSKIAQKSEDAINHFNEMVKVHYGEIMELHKAECQDCPWDGHTIFANFLPDY